jgi:hypothetical protein
MSDGGTNGNAPRSPRRLLENERAFKQLNEKVERLVRETYTEEEAAEGVGFFCECSNLECDARIRIGLEDWEAVHRTPDQFTLRHGHEMPEIERVIAETPDYVVVEKLIS